MEVKENKVADMVSRVSTLKTRFLSTLNFEAVIAMVLIVGLAVFCVRVYYLSGNSGSNNVSQVVNRPVIVNDPLKDSTQEYKEEVIDTLKQKISSSETEREKISYMLQMAYKAVVLRAEAPDETERNEAWSTLATVYESTINEPTLALSNELAVFGYVFSFAENCFPLQIYLKMPKEIKDDYFSIFNPEIKSEITTSTGTKRVQVMKRYMFESFIALIDNEKTFPILKMDVSLNSYSAIIKAVYLDSYSNQMTKKEIEKMVESINVDISEFNSPDKKFITGSGSSSSSRITIFAPMHIAFAEYVIGKFEKNLAGDTSKFDVVYSQIQTVEGDDIAKALALSFIKIYTIGVINRGEYSKEKVDSAVRELNTLIKNNPQITPVVKGYIAFGLNENGKWMLLKQDFFAVAKKSASLKAFLGEIGITGY